MAQGKSEEARTSLPRIRQEEEVEGELAAIQAAVEVRLFFSLFSLPALPPPASRKLLSLFHLFLIHPPSPSFSPSLVPFLPSLVRSPAREGLLEGLGVAGGVHVVPDHARLWRPAPAAVLGH